MRPGRIFRILAKRKLHLDERIARRHEVRDGVSYDVEERDALKTILDNWTPIRELLIGGGHCEDKDKAK